MKPAPLFNYRKRQRQAIVSDPQQHSAKASLVNSFPVQPKETMSDFGPDLCDFHTEQPGNAECHIGRNGNNVTGIGQEIKQNLGGLYPQEHAMKSNIQAMQDGIGRGQDNIASSVSRSKGTRGANFTCGRGFSGSKYPQQNTAGRGRGANTGKPSIVNQPNKTRSSSSGLGFSASSSSRTSSGFQNDCKTINNTIPGLDCSNSSLQNRGGITTTRGRGGSPQVRGEKDASCSNKFVASDHQGFSLGQGKMPAHLPRQESMFDDGDDSWIDQVPNNNPSKPERKGKWGDSATGQSSKTGIDMQETDQSLRVFTCPISAIRSWATSKLSLGIVMFEVYGVVDSATVRDNSGTGKEFVLRDDTGSINCIFYEIDRDLPRLTRGQVHRLVGLIGTRSDHLKVVSVRAAEKTERSICQMASNLSQEEMEAIKKSYNEP